MCTYPFLACFVAEVVPGGEGGFKMLAAGHDLHLLH